VFVKHTPWLPQLTPAQSDGVGVQVMPLKWAPLVVPLCSLQLFALLPTQRTVQSAQVVTSGWLTKLMPSMQVQLAIE